METARVGLLAGGAIGAAVERRLRTCADVHVAGVARTAAAALALAADETVDVVVDAFVDESSVPALLAAADRGAALVAANAAAVAVAGDRLDAAALFVDAALAGPSPRRLVTSLASHGGVAMVEACLDGWAVGAVAALAAGSSHEAVRRAANAAGRTDDEVRRSLDGLVAADALAVLASTAFGRPVRRDGVTVMGADWLTAADGARVRAEGRRWALVATATPACARVEPVPMPIGHPLATGNGRVLVVTACDGTRLVLHLGSGGPEAVAAAVTADVYEATRRAAAPNASLV